MDTGSCRLRHSTRARARSIEEHTNASSACSIANRRDLVTDNVALFQLLGEIFRDAPGRTKFQAGARYVAVPNRLEGYLSYGNRIGRESTAWWTIVGIRVQTAP